MGKSCWRARLVIHQLFPYKSSYPSRVIKTWKRGWKVLVEFANIAEERIFAWDIAVRFLWNGIRDTRVFRLNHVCYVLSQYSNQCTYRWIATIQESNICQGHLPSVWVESGTFQLCLGCHRPCSSLFSCTPLRCFQICPWRDALWCLSSSAKRSRGRGASDTDFFRCKTEYRPSLTCSNFMCTIRGISVKWFLWSKQATVDAVGTRT